MELQEQPNRRGTKDSKLSDWSAAPTSAAPATDGRRGTKESKLSDWTPAAAPLGEGAPSPEPVAARFVQQRWHRRFATQFAALFKKNLLVQVG